MEIEVKYIVQDDFAKEKILEDKHLQSISCPDSREIINMEAVYFDTKELALCKKEMALRVRYENGRPIATLKWGGGSEGSLHVRGELNVSVDETFANRPHIDIFKGSDIYEELGRIVGEDNLFPIMEMKCVRQQLKVDTGRSINVVSLDEGEIITPKGNTPICELEVELYSGEKEDMIALGKELAMKYNLEEGIRSKFQRGLELLEL